MGHPTANEGILKFLGFEQIFKNALTGLAMGGGKGGSDFNPKGKSDQEVIRFCQSFMTELARYLHPSTDVPAGDIGVGGREIGAMYGNVCQYAAEKCIEFGAKVMTVSDSSGVMVFENGMTTEELTMMLQCKNVDRARLSTLEGTGSFTGKYTAGETPWSLDIKYDIALPCATQNEINGTAATLLVKNGVFAVGEGANLPTDMEGQE